LTKNAPLTEHLPVLRRGFPRKSGPVGRNPDQTTQKTKIMQIRRTLLLLAALTAGHVRAAVIGLPLGRADPPSTLGGIPVQPVFASPFGDPRYTHPTLWVDDMPSPGGGNIGFSSPLQVLLSGVEWLYSRSGYTGTWYTDPGLDTLTLALPPGARAFYLHVGYDAFQLTPPPTVTVTANDGVSVAVLMDNPLDLRSFGFGFYATGGDTIQTIEISAPAGFGISEFGIATTAVPEPETQAAFAALGLLGFTLFRRLRGPRAKPAGA
jgi:hypothetical protein